MARDRRVAPGLVYGAIAGVNAACMSVLSLAARRMGVIDTMPPQVVQDWLVRRLGADPEGDVLHHATDHAVHVTIGAPGGAVYGALTSSRRPTSWSGVLPRENLVNIAAHAVYGGGAVLALFVGEMRAQRRRPASRPERDMTRLG